jgi:hypothetical protein
MLKLSLALQALAIHRSLFDLMLQTRRLHQVVGLEMDKKLEPLLEEQRRVFPRNQRSRELSYLFISEESAAALDELPHLKQLLGNLEDQSERSDAFSISS